MLFSRLVIISTLIDSLCYPLITAALATGKIKQYQLAWAGYVIIKFAYFVLAY